MPTLLDRAVRPLARRGYLSAPSPAPVVADLAEIATRATPRTAPDQDTQAGVALFRFPQRRGPLPEQARQFARTNPWFNAGMKRLKDRVARAERIVEPIDPDRPYSERLADTIRELIENPNPRMDSWRSFVEPVIDDYLTLGKGGWEYVRNWRGMPLALYPFDAALMRVEPTWDGSDPRAPRYWWVRVPHTPVGMRNDDVTLMVMNPTTDRPEGVSCVDALVDVVEAAMASNAFVRDMMKKYPPPGWLNLPSAGSRQVNAVTEKLQTDVLGRGGLLVTGGLPDAEYISLWNGNSRDNELMAWAIFFAKAMAAVLGISPQDLGITFDINRSTADSQQDVSDESGYASLLSNVEEYATREIVGKFGRPEQLNLRLRLKAWTLAQQRQRVELANLMIAPVKPGAVPLAKLNEGRQLAGLDPIDGGNALFAAATTAVLGDDAADHRQMMAQEATQQLQAQTDIASEAAAKQDDDKEAA